RHARLRRSRRGRRPAVPCTSGRRAASVGRSPRRPCPSHRQRRSNSLMRRRMMKSKIHRATVTSADLNYVGSISLDPVLMERADILEWEQVAVLDIDNGARFETYAIVGEPGQVQLNGAAARLAHPGSKVLLSTYPD